MANVCLPSQGGATTGLNPPTHKLRSNQTSPPREFLAHFLRELFLILGLELPPTVKEAVTVLRRLFGVLESWQLGPTAFLEFPRPRLARRTQRSVVRAFSMICSDTCVRMGVKGNVSLAALHGMFSVGRWRQVQELELECGTDTLKWEMDFDYLGSLLEKLGASCPRLHVLRLTCKTELDLDPLFRGVDMQPTSVTELHLGGFGNIDQVWRISGDAIHRFAPNLRALSLRGSWVLSQPAPIPRLEPIPEIVEELCELRELEELVLTLQPDEDPLALLAHLGSLRPTPRSLRSLAIHCLAFDVDDDTQQQIDSFWLNRGAMVQRGIEAGEPGWRLFERLVFEMVDDDGVVDTWESNGVGRTFEIPGIEVGYEHVAYDLD